MGTTHAFFQSLGTSLVSIESKIILFDRYAACWCNVAAAFDTIYQVFLCNAVIDILRDGEKRDRE